MIELGFVHFGNVKCVSFGVQQCCFCFVLHWTALDCIRLSWIALDCAGLHGTTLDCSAVVYQSDLNEIGL